jgi:hypothetical protein
MRRGGRCPRATLSGACRRPVLPWRPARDSLCTTKDDPTKVVLEPSDRPPECPPGSTNYAVATDCWQLTTDENAWDKCKESGQLISVLRTADEKNTPLTPGTLIGMNYLTCTDDIPGESHTSDRYQKCHY